MVQIVVMLIETSLSCITRAQNTPNLLGSNNSVVIVAIGYSITRYTTTKTIASQLLGNNCVEVEASKMLLTLQEHNTL
jgi:hypothetical protein